MADGKNNGPVDVNATGADASTADYVPLDDSSNSSRAQDTPIYGQDDDDGSASDVSMAAETDDESDVAPPPVPSAPSPRGDQPDAAVLPPAPPIQTNDEVGDVASRKRKSLADVPDEQNTLDTQEVKKVKTNQARHSPLSNGSSVHNKPTLPAEIWHHIFTFCPPRTLGKLLFVNGLFNLYLDPSSKIQRDESHSLPAGALALINPNSIWQASRRRFWPTMPTPLQDKLELHMWQLSCSTSCQFCGKPAVTPQPDLSDPWQSGPGKEGVSIVWSFASRSCGVCLLNKSVKVCMPAIFNWMRGLLTRVLGDRYSVVVHDTQHVDSSPTFRLRHPGTSCHITFNRRKDPDTTQHIPDEAILGLTRRRA